MDHGLTVVTPTLSVRSRPALSDGKLLILNHRPVNVYTQQCANRTVSESFAQHIDNAFCIRESRM
jgi:hypothetical protein